MPGRFEDAEGRVEVLLGDGESVVGSAIAEQPSRPGIYRPVVSPQRASELALRVRIEGSGLDATHELGKVTVHATTEEAAHAAATELQDEGTIGLGRAEKPGGSLAIYFKALD